MTIFLQCWQTHPSPLWLSWQIAAHPFTMNCWIFDKTFVKTSPPLAFRNCSPAILLCVRTLCATSLQLRSFHHWFSKQLTWQIGFTMPQTHRKSTRKQREEDRECKRLGRCRERLAAHEQRLAEQKTRTAAARGHETPLKYEQRLVQKRKHTNLLSLQLKLHRKVQKDEVLIGNVKLPHWGQRNR